VDQSFAACSSSAQDPVEVDDEWKRCLNITIEYLLRIFFCFTPCCTGLRNEAVARNPRSSHLISVKLIIQPAVSHEQEKVWDVSL
jgi:hypothetical protein